MTLLEQHKQAIEKNKHLMGHNLPNSNDKAAQSCTEITLQMMKEFAEWLGKNEYKRYRKVRYAKHRAKNI